MSPRMRRQSETYEDLFVQLTSEEADELSTALRRRLEKRQGFRPPGWHCHITDEDGNELTVGVLDDD